MSVDTINESINFIKNISTEKKQKIVEGDIAVPDIKPDILSLINIENEVYIKSYNASKDNVLINGIMEVNVLYMSEDESGSIKSLSNEFDFSESFELPGVDESSLIDVNLQKGTIECKIVNARKISFKSNVVLNVNASNMIAENVVKDVTDDRNVEVQKNDIYIQTIYDCKKEKVEIKENVSLDDDKSPIGEILRASIKILNEDYKISYNKILAKADAMIKIIYVADDASNTLESFETAVPIMSFIDFEGVDEKMDIKLEYMINSFLIRPIYQDMKATSFSIDSNLEVKVCAFKNEKFEIISDIYSTDSDVKCRCEDLELMYPIIDHIEDIELMQGILIPELENIKILDINATPMISNQNVLDEKLALEGNINFDVLYYNENKKILENKKMELPFAQVIKIPNLKSGMNVETKIKVVSVEYKKVDASGLQIKVILKVYVSSKRSDNVKAIKEIEMMESSDNNIPSLIIYYVKHGDSLWKIAKKFKTTVNEIKEFNELTDDTIYPGDRLLIPKKVKSQASELL